MHRLAGIWARLTGSLWFLPGAMTIGFGAAALLLVDLSIHFDEPLVARYPRIFEATPESARNMLSSIAGSIITVAGVTFSVMVVAVSQASSQYTPRVLRNFMRDRQSQLTLGVLVGVFVYCLLVLRSVRSDDSDFVPAIAVTAAILFAFIGVWLLMYFIHHISSTLEAGDIVAGVSRDTRAALDRLFPDELGEEADESGDDADKEVQARRWRVICARSTGYIQRVDTGGLLRLAAEHNTIVCMERGVGEFVPEQTPLARVAEVGSVEIDDELEDLYDFASYRTVHQDAEFGIRQIVDVGARALSPSVNDTTTAVTCIEYLTAIVVRAANRRIPSRLRYAEGELRVIARGPTFASMLGKAFDELRRNALNNVRALEKLAWSLETVHEATHSAGRREEIRRHARLVLNAIRADPDLTRECGRGLASCARILGEPPP